jgi:hypothetical protein
MIGTALAKTGAVFLAGRGELELPKSFFPAVDILYKVDRI